MLPVSPAPIVSIGAGGIVHDAHYPAYHKAGFPVAGLYDANTARAQQMATQWCVPAVYASLAEAVAGAPPDAIFDVAVPASAILDILTALPAARSVLIQKPLGEDLAQAQEIVRVCRQARLLAGVNFQLRYAPFILAARSLIQQGAIGEVLDVEVRLTVYTPWHLWQFMQGIPFPEILYHSIHYIDLVRSFLGEPQGVYAKSVRHPDSGLGPTRTTLILDYGDVVRATITTNHHHAYGLRHQESYVKWEGARGAIKARMGLLLNYPVGEPDDFAYCVLREGRPPRWRRVTLAGSWFPDAFIGAMASVMLAQEGTAPALPTSVEDALHTMAVVDAACRSSLAGGIPVPAL